jgi:hypothetical protein
MSSEIGVELDPRPDPGDQGVPTGNATGARSSKFVRDACNDYPSQSSTLVVDDSHGLRVAGPDGRAEITLFRNQAVVASVVCVRTSPSRSDTTPRSSLRTGEQRIEITEGYNVVCERSPVAEK